jgi:hypothetical protein
MIHSIVRNYVHKRAEKKKNFSARNFEFTFEKLDEIREKQKNKSQLTDKEKHWLEILPDFVAAVQDIAEELFIRFRGRRDKKSFANLFTETFFRAFYRISAKNMTALGGFVESDKWESAKRLVLMSISASAAIKISGQDESENNFDDIADDNQNTQEDEN